MDKILKKSVPVIEGPYGPWKETVPQSICAALGAHVPSARGQQGEQWAARMALVSQDALCPGEAAGAGNLVQGGEGAANDFFCCPDDPLKPLPVCCRGGSVPHGDGVGQDALSSGQS